MKEVKICKNKELHLIIIFFGVNKFRFTKEKLMERLVLFLLLEQLYIFPCKYNTKQPATEHGYKDAELGQNAGLLFAQGYNIGIACEPSGIIVIDCDIDESKDYDGIKTLREKEEELGKLPVTLTQESPRGGRHFIYQSKGIINPINKIGKDIDIKYNGYIMSEPSVINGKQYKYIDGINESGDPFIATLPDKWIEYLNKNSEIYKNKSDYKNIYRNIDIETLFQKCLFLQYCYNNADILSEPMWHSMITVLAQIEDSDELIHQISSAYPRYKFQETQKKIEYARKFGHSQSCRYLSANYPDVCAKCEYKYKKGDI